MNVLILAAGTRNKIGQYFRNALQGAGRVVATDASRLGPAVYEADAWYIVPPISDPGYLDGILDICRKERITGVLSLIDPELSLLAANEDRFRALGVTVIGSSYDLCEMSLDKMRMYRWLTDHGYACARSWTEAEAFRAAVTDPEHPGKNLRHPYAISRDEKFVLSFSDDFFANRLRSKETVGIIIREGRLFSSKTNKNEGHHLPNLDMIAQFPDGRLEVFRCNEITADELMALGVRNVYSFGPILIRDGVINELVYDYYKSAEPRQALGMIAPNHYFLLSVQGRNSDSKGTTLQRVAEIMKGHGVVQALNLDGGNTMALVFRGRMLNKLAVYKNRKFVRSVTSMIGIGETDNQSEE